MKKQVAIRGTNAREEARKRVCLEQLAQDLQKLLINWPFIGGIIMRMELIAVRDDRLDTACTDGDNIFVDIDFYSNLTKDERLFVLAHEVWHSVLLHFARCQKRNRERFNVATDLEIHFVLENEKMSEPFVLPHDESWKNLSAEEIYEKLPNFLKDWEQKQKSMGGGFMPMPGDGQQGKGFGNGRSSFDKHIYKDDDSPTLETQSSGDGDGGESQSKSVNSGQNQSSSQSGKQQSDGKQQSSGKQQSEGNSCGKQQSEGNGTSPANGAKASGEVFVIDKDYSPHVSSEAVERSRSRTIASAQQLERTQGKLPAGIKALIDRLQKPSLPWQEMLKQFVTTCYGGKRRWLPPARRHVWQDIYLPSMRDEALKAVVAIDTSGSTQNDLPVFFAELVSLMKSFGKFDLDVIQCDAKIQDVEHYSEANLPPPNRKWKVKGLGGTDFRPVFDYIQKNMRVQPDLLLFFTDGYGDAPKQRPAYPVMWVLTSDGRQPAEWGRATHFKKEEGK